MLTDGSLTSRALAALLLERIQRYDPTLRAVIETNPRLLEEAEALDAERRSSGPRGPLHGIPVLVKDNIDTQAPLHTTANSRALAGYSPAQDAFLVQRLRAAGALILGKASLTEFANFVTVGMPSGYGSLNGQTLNPYGRSFDVGGSSSGSAAGVAAGYAPLSVGTETSGSILNPASQCSLVAVKPTVGLISRSGIIPIAASQDTAGPMGRNVHDVAMLLEVLAGADPQDEATRSAPEIPRYTDLLDPGALRGVRLGVPRRSFTDRLSPEGAVLFERALEDLRAAGAELVDPCDLESAEALQGTTFDVLIYEFKRDLNRYLQHLPAPYPRSLAELISVYEADPERMLRYGQVLLLAAQATSGTLQERAYTYARERDLALSRAGGIDGALEQHGVEALVFPEFWGCSVAAKAGYPSVTVPAGYQEGGKPFNLTFCASAYSEASLLRFAYAYEQATLHRRDPDLEALLA